MSETVSHPITGEIGTRRVPQPELPEPREIVAREILSGVLVAVDREECGCLVYAVRKGATSEFMGPHDMASIQSSDCRRIGPHANL